jgi:hypothetical protein
LTCAGGCALHPPTAGRPAVRVQVLVGHPDAAAVASSPECVAAFQAGLGECLQRVISIQVGGWRRGVARGERCWMIVAASLHRWQPAMEPGMAPADAVRPTGGWLRRWRRQRRSRPPPARRPAAGAAGDGGAGDAGPDRHLPRGRGRLLPGPAARGRCTGGGGQARARRPAAPHPVPRHGRRHQPQGRRWRRRPGRHARAAAAAAQVGAAAVAAGRRAPAHASQPASPGALLAPCSWQPGPPRRNHSPPAGLRCRPELGAGATRCAVSPAAGR